MTGLGWAISPIRTPLPLYGAPTTAKGALAMIWRSFFRELWALTYTIKMHVVYHVRESTIERFISR